MPPPRYTGAATTSSSAPSIACSACSTSGCASARDSDCPNERAIGASSTSSTLACTRCCSDSNRCRTSSNVRDVAELGGEPTNATTFNAEDMNCSHVEPSPARLLSPL
ncbi:hypothetical protein G6F35_011086 [Rhizopus arrhizus]|nr:hypothetical protein G6F35_011086 [Rhizopus arrhizus]